MKKAARFWLGMAAIILLQGIPLDVVGAEEGWTGNLYVTLGSKRLDQDDWEPIDSQPGFGLMLDARQNEWPLSLALDLYYSGDEGSSGGVRLDGSTTELNFGIRKIWRVTRHFRPFIGVGSAFIRAKQTVNGPEIEERSESDSGAGVWIGGGLYWTLAQSLNVGFLLKSSTAKVTLLDERVDAGGSYFGTVIGLHW